MDVTLLEFRENGYCNKCYDERVTAFSNKHNMEQQHNHLADLSGFEKIG
jgi:hypothetical protein